MRALQLTATIADDHELKIQLPSDIVSGEYQIVLVLEEQPNQEQHKPFQFPVDDYGPWPVNLSLRREDM